MERGTAVTREGHETSTGQALSGAEWLDVHFEAARPEYEEMLRFVGVARGTRALDAGCGSGGYLPLLSELVGPGGSVHALDLAPENVRLVEERRVSGELPRLVEARVGALTELPYADGSFDALWCANTVQFLGDAELGSALAEFRRVTRPGGIVAVKDVDVTLARLYPASPFLFPHLSEAILRADPDDSQSRGSVRGRELRRWLERSGLREVRQKTFMIERWAPFRPAERRFFGDWLSYLARLAEERGVPGEDLETWRALGDADAPDHPLDRPDAYACEGQVVAVGRVPEAGGRPS
ncbi:class I SAM-dependent methyltransferase [Rubrobacter marinus]|nr:class I SAM-dependent methyltransferase [Rubrobacter marinus]